MLSRSPSKVILSAEDIPKRLAPCVSVKLSAKERILGSGLGPDKSGRTAELSDSSPKIALDHQEYELTRFTIMTAPTPPSFPNSLRSNPEFPRPKPPPIVTKKAASVDAIGAAKVEESNSRVRKSSNRKKRPSLKNKAIEVQSPSDGDVIILSNEDLKNNRPKSADTVRQESNLSLESYDFADVLGAQMPHKIQPLPDAKFIDDGGKFIKFSDQERIPQLIDTQSWERINLNLARNLQINRHSFLHVFQAYYAGLCLLSLIILPSFSSFIGGDVTINDPVYLFYAYYSRNAQNMSLIFNFFVTLAVLAGCDIVLGERRTVSHRPFTLVFMVKLGIIICGLISIISNSILVGLDDEFYCSGTDDRFGGDYGMPNWYSDKSKMDAAQGDFFLWKSLNIVRGLFGIINWLLCSLCLDKTRYWSIVDPEARIQNLTNDLNSKS